ncbi:MAG TPA: GTP pyrophosphokinase [Ruminococcaceae bacterium]|nr:GTP pyrophosphokinase [Oscillospiraceae bacterium]
MIDIKDIETKKLLESASGILEQTRPFTELMMRYKCAMLEVKTKLDVLNTQLSLENDRNPFESINCRLKTVPSIIEKLNRKGFELSAASIEKNLNDVAGIRVICSFPDDIYVLADKLCSQDDIRLIEKKDYIKNPKPNGYRSLHLIVEIPIFLMTEKKLMRVEVQFRTIAMDFWASLEHKLKYKKDIKSDVNEISRELKECAEEISRLDDKMQEIHRKINYNNDSASINFELPI